MVDKLPTSTGCLVVYPIIYRVLAPSQVVIWDFSHQQYGKSLSSFNSTRTSVVSVNSQPSPPHSDSEEAHRRRSKSGVFLPNTGWIQPKWSIYGCCYSCWRNVMFFVWEFWSFSKKTHVSICWFTLVFGVVWLFFPLSSTATRSSGVFDCIPFTWEDADWMTMVSGYPSLVIFHLWIVSRASFAQMKHGNWPSGRWNGCQYIFILELHISPVTITTVSQVWPIQITLTDHQKVNGFFCCFQSTLPGPRKLL